jgi:hypothetical protein
MRPRAVERAAAGLLAEDLATAAALVTVVAAVTVDIADLD